MKLLIVIRELSADRLKQIPIGDCSIVTLHSIAEAIQWSGANHCDLIFIQLCFRYDSEFDCFLARTVGIPIIFIDVASNCVMPPHEESALGFQQRFLVHVGVKIKSIPVEQAAYFMADGKYLHLFTFDGGNYLIDQTLSGVGRRVDPHLFFQINRKFIIHYRAIGEMIRHSNNRIKVGLTPRVPSGTEAIVSQERIAEFRAWLNR